MAYAPRAGWSRALAAAALLIASTAHAGGLSFVEYEAPPGGPMNNNALKDAEELAVSPDGANLYTASVNEDSLGVFTRDPGTGAITFLEVEEDGVAGVDGLRRTSGVAVSPDGNCVYGTGEQDDGLAVFSRNLIDGSLTFVATAAVDDPQSVVVSPDGLHVYAIGTDGTSAGAVHAFSRTPPACALSFVEAETGDADGLGKGPEALAVSPDGAHVYVAGSFFDGKDTQGAVIVLSRNPGTGALTFVERQVDGVAGVTHLTTVLSAIVVSPDGATVYVTSRGGSSLVAFDRDAGTGELTFLEAQRDGGGNDGLKGASAVAVDPNDAYVYVVGRGDTAVGVFRRDTVTGALAFLEVQRDTLIDPPNEVLPAPIGLAVSPGADSLYAGGKGVTIFAIDVCGNGTRGVDEQCDDGNLVGGDGCSATCRLELCGALPAAGCRDTLPLAAQLQIKNDAVNRKDQLQWKWSKGDATLLAEFGDPLATASYLLCVWDASGNSQPLVTAAAPAGGTCKSGKPCWKAATTSYKYNDGLYTPDGIQGLQLKEGLVDGKAKIQAKARGVNLATPGLPLTPPVTVQLHNTETSVCWEAVFTAPTTNDGVKFKSKGD